MNHKRTMPRRGLLVLVLACLAAVPGVAAAASLGGLNAQLSQERDREGSISRSLSSLTALISTLTQQITLVQGREASVRAALARDQAELASSRHELAAERIRVAALEQRLQRARSLLSRQLLSSYEGGQQDLVSVLLEAHGFNDLLERITFLRMAEHEQQALITLTRRARTQAQQAQAQYAGLTHTYAGMTAAAALQANALQGMNLVLQAKQGSLSRARAIQQQALDASRARSSHLTAEIRQLQAEQAAAAQAAAERAAAAQAAAQRAAAQAPFTPATPALGPSGGWAIPYPIVLCESGGQNLPPNGASASGYYQITAATWRGEGGTGPAAYLAPKSEQDAVASRLWNGGAGASNWVCAGIVGIH